MRYIAIGIAFCFMLAPLEAKTHSNNIHLAKLKKNKVKGRKAPRHSKPKVHRVKAN